MTLVTDRDIKWLAERLRAGDRAVMDEAAAALENLGLARTDKRGDFAEMRVYCTHLKRRIKILEERLSWTPPVEGVNIKGEVPTGRVIVEKVESDDT